MKKITLKVFVFIIVVAINFVFLTACNKDSNLPEGVTVGTGDNIFTSGATLEQLSYALENADSFVIKQSYSPNGEYILNSTWFCDRVNNSMVYRIIEVDLHSMTIAREVERYLFTDSDKFYYIGFSNYHRVPQEDGSSKIELNPKGKLIIEFAQKSDTPFNEYVAANTLYEGLLSNTLTMKDGHIVYNEEKFIPDDWGDNVTFANFKIDLKGSEIVTSYTVNYGANFAVEYSFIIAGVNATRVEIPDKVSSYKDQAVQIS